MTERKQTPERVDWGCETKGVWILPRPNDPDYDELIEVATDIKTWLEHGSLDRADPPYERLCKALRGRKE